MLARRVCGSLDTGILHRFCIERRTIPIEVMG
jgi:hypothetical protein